MKLNLDDVDVAAAILDDDRWLGVSVLNDPHVAVYNVAGEQLAQKTTIGIPAWPQP